MNKKQKKKKLVYTEFIDFRNNKTILQINLN